MVFFVAAMMALIVIAVRANKKSRKAPERDEGEKTKGEKKQDALCP